MKFVSTLSMGFIMGIPHDSKAVVVANGTKDSTNDGFPCDEF